MRPRRGWKVLAVGLGVVAGCLTGLGETRAQGFEITPLLGYRLGGGFEDVDGDPSVDIENDMSYGLLLGWDMDGESTFEIFYTRQSTALEADAVLLSGTPFDLDVHTLEFGGTFHFEDGNVRPFVAGGLGYTLFEPDAPGVDSEGGFTLGMGGGVRVKAAEHVAFRFEGRGHLTFLTDSGTLFCTNNTCILQAEGSVLFQFEALGGVVIRF